MAKKRYKFNPQTLTYEVIAIPFRIKFYRLLRKILIGFILASIVNLLFSFFFYTPKMYAISEKNNELLIKYEIFRDKVRSASAKLNEIRHRDNKVYRPLFAADSLSLYGIYTPYAEHKYARMEEDRYAPLMIGTWMELDALTRLLYLESKSLDQLQLLAKDKELMAEAIPAIWPINKKNLRGHIGMFSSSRFHPILKRVRKHDGIDLGGRKGDPVYATGNGKVVSDGMVRGYGNQILLDHGFGYRTRYAHLSKILVVPGQEVKRGELIGEVGSTGLSQAPHLHYEVLYRGRPVDPLNYFSRDMSEEEFERIVESAGSTTFEKD